MGEEQGKKKTNPRKVLLYIYYYLYKCKYYCCVCVQMIFSFSLLCLRSTKTDKEPYRNIINRSQTVSTTLSGLKQLNPQRKMATQQITRIQQFNVQEFVSLLLHTISLYYYSTMYSICFFFCSYSAYTLITYWPIKT